MKTCIHLRCLAYDGEAVIEGRDFESIEAAWSRAEDMGSRWFFYPVCVVTGEAKILDVPRGMDEGWIGKHLKTLVDQIKLLAASSEVEDQKAVGNWVNGDAPCPLFP
jgi:hypothetical protein